MIVLIYMKYIKRKWQFVLGCTHPRTRWLGLDFESKFTNISFYYGGCEPHKKDNVDHNKKGNGSDKYVMAWSDN